MTAPARAVPGGGFSAQRSPSDFLETRASGNLFTAWSGPSEMAIEQLQVAAGFKGARAASSPDDTRDNDAATSSEWLDAAIKNFSATWSGLAIVIAIIVGYLSIVAAYSSKASPGLPARILNGQRRL